jgi:phage gp29-like protein
MAPERQSGPPVSQYLDIPVLTDWRTTDSVSRLRGILVAHEHGMFTQSAMFVDEMLSDDRISGVLNTRIGGLLGAPLTFRPADERRKSQKLAEILGGTDEANSDGEWLRMLDQGTAAQLLKWRIMLGFAIAEKVWVTTDKTWSPRLVVWHPKYTWWNWAQRCFQLATSGPDPNVPAENQEQIPGGGGYLINLPRADRQNGQDGKWFVWGGPYSWMSGAIRSLGMKYVDRQWTERDWARYCEKHGMAIIEGKVPSGTEESEKAAFLTDLHNVGNEATIITPQGGDGQPSYGVELHEASANTWQTFKSRKESLDTDIAILLLGQNLTTNVQGGSRAAASVHDDIRIEKKREDAELFRQVREQVLIPWAEYNFEAGKGNALAPYPEPQIAPPDDEQAEANALKLLGDALTSLKAACPRVDVEGVLEAQGIPLLAEDDPKAQPPPPPPVLQIGPDGKPIEPDPQDDGAEPPEPPEGKETATAYLKAGFKPGSMSHKRIMRYQDTLITRARRKAAQALAPSLEGIRADLEQADDYASLKRAIVRRYRRMDPTQLAVLVERVNKIANLQGRAAVAKGK